MISCVLLAAGFSSRFGSPKALAKVNQKTVIEHLQHQVLGTSVGEIIVVLGDHADMIKPYLLNHRRVKFVYNKDYNLGQTSSFKVGLQSIHSDSEGIMLLPIDYPAVKVKTLEILMEYFLKNKPLILIPAFEGQKGHPPIFDIKLKEEFLGLDNEAGLNTVAFYHQGETLVVDVRDEGIVATFNTREDFEKIKKGLKNII